MSNNLKSKILKSIKNKKLNVFALFFLMTFIFLGLTKLSKKYSDNITLDITYVNLPKHKIITLDSLPKCKAVVSAYGFNLMAFHLKKQFIQVDFNRDVYVKDSTFIWVPNKFKYKILGLLGNSAEVISFDQDTIRFPFETLSVKKVPVVLNSNIIFKSGYDILNHFTIQPDSVNVIGSVSNISEINKAETELLSLKNVSDTLNKMISLKKLENKKVTFSVNDVNISAKVEKFTEGTLEIPISIVNKPLDVSINYFPKSISVTYDVSLNNFKNIKPMDFRLECDFSEIENTDNAFFIPKLVKIPELVKNVRLKQNKVEFILMQ